MGAPGSWGHLPQCHLLVPLRDQGNRHREAQQEAPRTCGVNALHLHVLAPTQERTRTPCPGAAWVARMSHSEAAAGSKMLAVPSTTPCLPPCPRPASAPRVPCRHPVSPCVAVLRGGRQERACQEQEAVSGSAVPCHGHRAGNVGVAGASGTACRREAVHSLLRGLLRVTQTTHMTQRGALHFHARVPCPVKAAHAAHAAVLTACWGSC